MSRRLESKKAVLSAIDSVLAEARRQLKILRDCEAKLVTVRQEVFAGPALVPDSMLQLLEDIADNLEGQMFPWRKKKNGET